MQDDPALMHTLSEPCAMLDVRKEESFRMNKQVSTPGEETQFMA